MKQFKKVLAGVAVAAALATSAHAALINVGGIVFDPNSPIDFSGSSDSITQSINPVTGELTGFGYVSKINNTKENVFSPGAELTFQYSGFLPSVATAIPGPLGGGSQIQYTGGIVKFFVDTTPDTNFGTNLTFANTGDGTLWLDLVGHPQAGGITFVGTNFFPTSLQGAGLLDVIGGLAAANLDTNTQQGGADLKFSSTFTTFTNSLSPLEAIGAGTVTGNSIPEPESLALVGLGLLGLAASRRRKSV